MTFHGTQGLALSVHFEGPSAPLSVHLFVQSSHSHSDPLEPGGLDAAGCRVPAGPLIVQKSWGLFQRKLQSISGEWNLKGPNPFFPPNFKSGFRQWL